ncbi:hypothetical protein CDD80_5682 [Ophiocordyceps camponoti-rufipedis]|uniref:Cwf19-like C-terminal domain-containing protein n=1 Tax=Ophiocordyceps camponoti-rufipedis TaxID=2004952 RepID=A0A2C5XFU0_9HYPO|nr:hypothetical protein CDD80_5682 [Ophiocordyceps camponoti-rufipedis]
MANATETKIIVVVGEFAMKSATRETRTKRTITAIEEDMSVREKVTQTTTVIIIVADTETSPVKTQKATAAIANTNTIPHPKIRPPNEAVSMTPANPSRELNVSLKNDASQQAADEEYTFGDDGSSWRMTKLKAVEDAAAESGRAVEEIAVEKYGSLREFDDAREERIELERRDLYGEGYTRCERPTGRLYRERRLDETITTSPPPSPEPNSSTPQQQAPSPTTLNRLRAQAMKAKLLNAPNAASLEASYNLASKASLSNTVVLDAPQSRHLTAHKSAQSRAPSEMTVEEMAREERRTRHQGDSFSAARQAERIARDGRFEADLDYQDDHAARLASGVQRSEAGLRSSAVSDARRMARMLDRCPLCRDSDDHHRSSRAPIISLGTRVYLTLSPTPEITPGGAVIAPLSHHSTLLECDDDEWHEIRNFMKCLTRMYHAASQSVIFHEDSSSRTRHATMTATPIPQDRSPLAPAFFREALLASGPEWSTHPKIIDTRTRGGLRRSLPRAMPAYFHQGIITLGYQTLAALIPLSGRDWTP